MARKFAGLQDYTVCKLECQWWIDGPEEDLSSVPQDQWHWKMMIRTPDFVGLEDLKQATAKLLEKGKSARVKDVAYEQISEGQSYKCSTSAPMTRKPEPLRP